MTQSPAHILHIKEVPDELAQGRHDLAELLDVPDIFRLCDLIDILKWRIQGIDASVQTIKERIS